MDKQVTAKSKYIRGSAQKGRLVIDLIRGMRALDAVTLLKFTNKAAALPIRKCLESAIANAINNNDLDKSKLYIVEARVDEATTYKRGRAVARGRYHRILKRNCHIFIKLEEKDVQVKEKQEKKQATKKQDITVKSEQKEEKKKGTEQKKTTSSKKTSKKKTTKKSTSTTKKSSTRKTTKKKTAKTKK
jgi:large subunit ribosomal protein L22